MTISIELVNNGKKVNKMTLLGKVTLYLFLKIGKPY